MAGPGVGKSGRVTRAKSQAREGSHWQTGAPHRRQAERGLHGEHQVAERCCPRRRPGTCSGVWAAGRD